MATPPNPPRRPVDLTGRDPLEALHRWVADGRVDAAARDRARRRWLAQQADEEATVGGVVLELAERGAPIAVTTRAGRTVRGTPLVAGADFVALQGAPGGVVVPFGALATVRVGPGDRPPTGDRVAALELVLAEALAELAASRPRVALATAGDEVRGELRSAGFDVVAVTLDGPDRATVHVAIGALDHLVVLG